MVGHLPRTLALLAGLATAAYAQDDALRKGIDESRRMAIEVSRNLSNQLVREMQLSGPLRSMAVCRYTCPEILSAPSRRTGWRIVAVSLKPRNPALGSPDTWEQKVLMSFRRRVEAGESAEQLEFAEVVEQPLGRFLRYARSIPVEKMCLACHGSPDAISDAVRTRLAADYPQDKAVDFAVGQVYGILSIKRAF